MEFPTMQWGVQQDKALSKVAAWLKNPGGQQVFRLFGYAGTGKTTLAKHFAEGAGRVAFGAYTGKAALVLRQKGCLNAATLHSMIYLPSPKSEADIAEMREELFKLKLNLSGEGLEDDDIVSHRKVTFLQEQITDENARLSQPRFTLNRNSDVKSCDLIIVDEVTMVGTRVAEDLCSFGVPILVLGDPGQLPPVGDGGYFTKQRPDILLTEIHRQAKGSPILKLATDVRMGKPLQLGKYGESEVISKAELKERSQDVVKADMVLCGRNRTRMQSNQRLRELSGITNTYPVVGETLVCLRNNAQEGLLNGGLWTVQDVKSHSDDLRRHMTMSSNDEPITVDVEALSMIFRGEDTSAVDYFTIASAAHFDFGRCLTTHKFQGSQAEHGVIIDESSCFRGFEKNHLYTSITRFSDRVLIAID
jgi:ATP-dependent exoDNAse (exonuclease V) alpha subunit